MIIYIPFTALWHKPAKSKMIDYPEPNQQSQNPYQERRNPYQQRRDPMEQSQNPMEQRRNPMGEFQLL